MIGDPLMGGSPLAQEMTPDEMQKTRNRLDDLEHLGTQDSIYFMYDMERYRWWAKVQVDEGWCRSVVWFQVPYASQETLDKLHAESTAKAFAASEVFDDACD